MLDRRSWSAGQVQADSGSARVFGRADDGGRQFGAPLRTHPVRIVGWCKGDCRLVGGRLSCGDEQQPRSRTTEYRARTPVLAHQLGAEHVSIEHHRASEVGNHQETRELRIAREAHRCWVIAHEASSCAHPSSTPSTRGTPAHDQCVDAEGWRNAMREWALPDAILAAAPESPWGFPAELFRSRAELVTPGELTFANRRARDALPAGGTVLDVGVGAGAASLPLSPRCSLITRGGSSGREV